MVSHFIYSCSVLLALLKGLQVSASFNPLELDIYSLADHFCKM